MKTKFGFKFFWVIFGVLGLICQLCVSKIMKTKTEKWLVCLCQTKKICYPIKLFAVKLLLCSLVGFHTLLYGTYGFSVMLIYNQYGYLDYVINISVQDILWYISHTLKCAQFEQKIYSCTISPSSMGLPLQVFCKHKNLKVLEYVEYWINSVSNMTSILRLNPSCIGLSPKEDHRICRFSKVCLTMQQSLCDSLLITVIQQYTLLKGKKIPWTQKHWDEVHNSEHY